MSIEKLPVFENFPDEDKKLSKLIKWIKNKIYQPVSRKINFLLSLVNSGFVEIPADDVAPGADGNWRWRVDGSDLVLQRKISGTWTDTALKVLSSGITRIGDVDSTDFTQISASGNITQAGTAITTLDQIYLNEIGSAPTHVADDGVLYTNSKNELRFQDGDNGDHLIHADSFSNIWFHDVVVDTVTIAAADTFVVVSSFDDIGDEDDLNNLIANTTNNDLTVGVNGAGEYNATFHLSAGSGGAADEFVIVIGQALAIPITITAATTATPIVCTAVAHGIRKGDMVTISGGTGMTAINGDWFLKPVTADTFTLLDLQGANSVGSGTYDVSSAAVDIIYHGNIVLHRTLAQNQLGTGGGNADVRLAASDKLKLYVANIGGTDDIDFTIVNMEAKRIGD